MLTIREASGQDQGAVVEVIRAVYDEYGFGWHPEGYHADLYDLDRSYRDQGDVFYLARWNGKAAGTAALELFDPVPEGVTEPLVRLAGCDCSIERVYVHPEFRRLGIGRALSEHVIAEAKRRGRKRMEIWSDFEFRAAHQMYAKLGAKTVAQRLCDDPNQSPEHGMVLELAMDEPG